MRLMSVLSRRQYRFKSTERQVLEMVTEFFRLLQMSQVDKVLFFKWLPIREFCHNFAKNPLTHVYFALPAIPCSTLLDAAPSSCPLALSTYFP